MLAQNFKAAAELGIDEWEVEGLIRVLGMLERRELQFCKSDGDWNVPNGFNMGNYDSEECGTVLCIGGWVAHTAERDIGDYVKSYIFAGPLNKLYWQYPTSTVKVDEAAAAVRNYLTTGDPQWDEVVSS